MGFAFALWTPLLAAASGAECVEPTPQRLAESALSPQRTDLADSLADLSHGPTQAAESRLVPASAPLRTLSARQVEAIVDAHSAAGTDEGIAWCTNRNDPRCAPLPADPESDRIDGRILVNAVGAEAQRDRWPPLAVSFNPAPGLSPAIGIRHRLERPPRLGR